MWQSCSSKTVAAVMLGGGLVFLASLRAAAQNAANQNMVEEQTLRAGFARMSHAPGNHLQAPLHYCQEAVAIWRPLAERGDPDAQVLLAALYSGDVVSMPLKDVPGMSTGNECPEIQSDTEAFVWWTRAATDGIAEAQETLGRWYALGRATQRDFVSAYGWLDASGAGIKWEPGVVPDGWRWRDCLAKVMSPEQIAKAQDFSQSKRVRRKGPFLKLAGYSGESILFGNGCSGVTELAKTPDQHLVTK